MPKSNVASWPQLAPQDAMTFAAWFECLAEPTRLRLLHAVAVTGRALAVGELADGLGISQSTCSHHVRKLAEAGFVLVRREATATLVSVNVACCTGMPHAADVIMGLLGPQRFDDPPPDVVVRPLRSDDWASVRRIYAEGIAARKTTFETEVPSRRSLDHAWLPDHRWIAEIDGQVAGWAAARPLSRQPAQSGVAETSIYLGDGFYGRGAGRALIRRLVAAADEAGLWTLETSIFPENRERTKLHLYAGFRTLGVRERVGRHQGEWRDTVVLERRRGGGPA